MIYHHDSGTVVYDQDGATGFLLNNENGCEYVRLELQSDSKIPPHALPFPVTFFVIAGRGKIEVGGEIKEIESGNLIEVSPSLDRGLLNDSNDLLQVLVIKHVG